MDTLERLKPFFEAKIPFHRCLGLKVEEVQPGRCRARLPFRDDLVGDVFHSSPHSGALYSLAEIASLIAVLAETLQPKQRVIPCSAGIDFFSLPSVEDCVAEASIAWRGPHLAHARTQLYTHPQSTPFAEARFLFHVRLPD